ncbi:hypothetical protein G6F37_012002 [Rhizopus arrhizus]|nr:hypothetical protein G6F38_012038 [Rhizopus arrhizus]KAG1146258.1 hypothetical protein G6F37_012002 [Rhizopus arrhizus]
MALSSKKHMQNLNPARSGKSKQTTAMSWNKIVSKNIEPLGRPPTQLRFTQRTSSLSSTNSSRRSSVSSMDSLFNENAQQQIIRPYIKGIEKNSVLVDVTDIKSPDLCTKAFQAFNNGDSDNDDGDEDYLGRSLVVRKYLNRVFIETQWALGSRGRNTLLNEGITLDDGTAVKGYPSLPAEAQITRLKLERLPLQPVRKLTKAMEARLSCFGKVLDLGLIRSRGCNVGIGYATLDIDPKASPERVLEKLHRVIDWDEGDGDFREVFLQWDEMPPFCRICQSGDHCRADCPDLKKFIECYNCNKKGHLMRDCPRNNRNEQKWAPNKKPTSPSTLARKGELNHKSEVSSEPESRPSSSILKADHVSQDQDTVMIESHSYYDPSRSSNGNPDIAMNNISPRPNDQPGQDDSVSEAVTPTGRHNQSSDPTKEDVHPVKHPRLDNVSHHTKGSSPSAFRPLNSEHVIDHQCNKAYLPDSAVEGAQNGSPSSTHPQ